jgi:hypothetical protein
LLLGPLLPVEIVGLFFLDGADGDDGVGDLLVSEEFEGSADDAGDWFVEVGEADENGDIFDVALDIAAGAVEGVDPEAEMFEVELLVDIGEGGEGIESELAVVVVDGALEVFGFFADDAQLGEVHFEALDHHGLNFEIRLDCLRNTSVTRSSGPL